MRVTVFADNAPGDSERLKIHTGYILVHIGRMCDVHDMYVILDMLYVREVNEHQLNVPATRRQDFAVVSAAREAKCSAKA